MKKTLLLPIIILLVVLPLIYPTTYVAEKVSSGDSVGYIIIKDKPAFSLFSIFQAVFPQPILSSNTLTKVTVEIGKTGNIASVPNTLEVRLYKGGTLSTQGTFYKTLYFPISSAIQNNLVSLAVGSQLIMEVQFTTPSESSSYRWEGYFTINQGGTAVSNLAVDLGRFDVAAGIVQCPAPQFTTTEEAIPNGVKKIVSAITYDLTNCQQMTNPSTINIVCNIGYVEQNGACVGGNECAGRACGCGILPACQVCGQAITKGCNPATKEIREFSTTCLAEGFITDLSQCELNCAKEGEKTRFNFPCCSGLIQDKKGFAGIGDTCLKVTEQTNLSDITKCNPETLENCPKKLTISADKLASSTLKDRLSSQCERSAECTNNNCVSLKKLEDDGFLTKKDADTVASDLKGTITGTGIGAVGGLALCVAGAGFLGFSTGGLLTFPILVGVCGGSGALTGGIAGYWSAKGIQAIQSGNKEGYGFCIEQESSSGFSWEKFVSSIGKGINDAFGGKAKTNLDNSTMGYIVLIVVAIIAFIALSGRK